MSIPWQLPVFSLTTLYQIVACARERTQALPGQLIDVGGYNLHLSVVGKGQTTIVLDHSLGGVEGYLLVKRLAHLGRVVIYDRAGYGWSDHSPHPRTSQQMVNELHSALSHIQIPPPYILIGDSFGSYNVRLYAECYPQQVQGLVLTDGLHETEMNALPWSLQIIKFVFISGFIMSILGASLGLIRLLSTIGVFQLIKPQLRQFSTSELRPVIRSFCRPKHWLTMTRELWHLYNSGNQLLALNTSIDVPIVSIKAHSFFTPALFTRFLPLNAMNKIRHKIHKKLSHLSKTTLQLSADRSSHFVWIDQPDLIVDATAKIIKIIHDENKS